jgi:hypothetical protein
VGCSSFPSAGKLTCMYSTRLICHTYRPCSLNRGLKIQEKLHSNLLQMTFFPKYTLDHDEIFICLTNVQYATARPPSTSGAASHVDPSNTAPTRPPSTSGAASHVDPSNTAPTRPPSTSGAASHVDPSSTKPTTLQLFPNHMVRSIEIIVLIVLD